MNQHDRDDLQRWLDGSLDEPASIAFEERLAADPELREELELHRSVTSSVQRSFSVPEIEFPVQADLTRPRRWPPFLLGAASAAAVLLAWLQPWGATPQDFDRRAEQVAIMRTAVGRSWLAICERPDLLTTPQTSCSMPDDLPQYVQPLAPELPSPLVWRAQPGVLFERGLESNPKNGLRVLELIVLPRTEVHLFIVPTTADPQPTLPPDSELRLFRQTRGPLVLYELTPLDQPHGFQCLPEID